MAAAAVAVVVVAVVVAETAIEPRDGIGKPKATIGGLVLRPAHLTGKPSSRASHATIAGLGVHCLGCLHGA